MPIGRCESARRPELGKLSVVLGGCGEQELVAWTAQPKAAEPEDALEVGNSISSSLRHVKRSCSASKRKSEREKVPSVRLDLSNTLDIQRELTLLDQPGQVLRRAIGAVGDEALRLAPSARSSGRA